MNDPSPGRDHSVWQDKVPGIIAVYCGILPRLESTDASPESTWFPEFSPQPLEYSSNVLFSNSFLLGLQVSATTPGTFQVLDGHV